MGDGSRGVSTASGVLSLTLLEASLCLPVVGRKPCPHLPCSQVDPSPGFSGDGYSHPRARWMLVDRGWGGQESNSITRAPGGCCHYAHS